MGWHTADTSWWPVISESLTGKWSREAALMDLRWYGDRRNYTGQAMPGRRVLSKRWSWKPGAVRWLLASDEWDDPRWEQQPGNSPPTARLQPGNDPPTAQEQPADDSSKADNEDVSDPPTTRLQPGNDPPTTRLQPNNSPPFRDTTPTQAHPPTQAPEEAEVSSPTTADPGKRSGNGSTEPIAKAEVGLFSAGPVKPAALPARQTKLSGKRKKADVDPDAFDWLAKLWASEALETRPPGARPKQPPKYTATSKAGPTAGLKRLIRDVGEQDTALLIRWYWGGPDERGNREAGRGLITIARHSEEYITLASDWSEGIQPIKPRGSGGSWGDMLREELNKGGPNGL